MKNVSKAFAQELARGNRNYIKSADITLRDGTELHLDNSKLWQNGLKVEDSTSSTSSFDIGSAIIGKLTITLNNIYDEYSDYDFTDASIKNVSAGLELPDGKKESLKYGKYTVNETNYNGSIITLTCYDNMYKFDRPYSKSNLTYPATLGDIVRDACSVCGVSLGTPSFENDDFVVKERPADENITFRNVLTWVAQITCNYCKMDEQGRLLIEWYKTNILEKISFVSGGSFNPWPNDKNIDGGSFNPWTEGQLINGGNFQETKDYVHVYSIMSMNLSVDDVVITGVKVTEEVERESGKESVSYQTGEDGYVLEISGNKLIQGQGELVSAIIGQKVIGLRFRPANITCISDPRIEASDIAIITDRKGNSYKTIITNNTFQPGNTQNVVCGAKTPLRNSASRYSEATQAYVDLRKDVEKQKTEWEKAMENLAARINNSSGLYMTKKEQEDGSSIYYMHNKPTLEESMFVWKMTAEAMAVSTDGGETWNAGLTVDGELITKIMNTIGLNFDWGVGGTLVIQDSNGEETFYVNANTGEVRMNAKRFSLKGDSIEKIVDEETRAKFSATNSEISAEISRAKEAEDILSSAIKINAEEISQKVSAGDVESLIEQKADSIRLKADKISWNSTYSSMTESGVLTCKSATIGGFTTTSNGFTSNYRTGTQNLVHKQVQVLNAGYDQTTAIVVRTRENSSSSLIKRVEITYDGEITIYDTNTNRKMKLYDGNIDWYEGSKRYAYIHSNSSDSYVGQDTFSTPMEIYSVNGINLNAPRISYQNKEVYDKYK